MEYNPEQFSEKYKLALSTAEETKPESGVCGCELELNMLDGQFRPLLTVGSGPDQQSFVDFIRAECLPEWSQPYSQLEVFHWMIEWATRPYYHPKAVVYETRMMEATLLNALHKAGQKFGENIYAWHGNLLSRTEVGPDSIPGSWHLAKRRYLERCVDLYGHALATAGTHTNLSLPDPLLAWDFMHLAPEERSYGGPAPVHLDDYKSQVYVTLTRLMRAFASLFIATGASTPLQVQKRSEKLVVVVTENDSVRNLTFPNPAPIDQPNLYRSYEDYLETSYDLVRRGIRFGNNNWTPVRARSYAEPVERLILVTSEQLHDLYARGLYAAGKENSADAMAEQIEIQNLMARINLPMARVEVRTDDGGCPLDVDIANLTLKHLLMLRFYADPTFGRAFRYDGEDIARARRNEDRAARMSLRAEIEHPFTGKNVSMREFLRWTLMEVRPLAEALGFWTDLTPLVEMSAGRPNTAEALRARLHTALNGRDEVPMEWMQQLANERIAQVQHDIHEIVSSYERFDQADEIRIGDWIKNAMREEQMEWDTAVQYLPDESEAESVSFKNKTDEILHVAEALIKIPSVTACPEERIKEVHQAAAWIRNYAGKHGLELRSFSQGKYPAMLISFPDEACASVMLSGHFDVVAPEPDDRQFKPIREGDYLIGRGSADMKTVVATYLVWMKDIRRKGPPYPPINLLLVGNEENGEADEYGTPHVLRELAQEIDQFNRPYAPQMLIAGERTGEHGDEAFGEICIQNRGVMRFEIQASGKKGHSGLSGPQSDLTERLFRVRQDVDDIFRSRLTLTNPDGWNSQIRFPYLNVGRPGMFNITADVGVLGVEVRPIPEDDVTEAAAELSRYCETNGLKLVMQGMENGIACSPDNPYLQALVQAVEELSGKPVVLGKKLPGTSARFAPGGQGVVWGQTGIGPHSSQERHYIPSIDPYYRALDRFAQILIESKAGKTA